MILNRVREPSSPSAPSCASAAQKLASGASRRSWTKDELGFLGDRISNEEAHLVQGGVALETILGNITPFQPHKRPQLPPSGQPGPQPHADNSTPSSQRVKASGASNKRPAGTSGLSVIFSNNGSVRMWTMWWTRAHVSPRFWGDFWKGFWDLSWVISQLAVVGKAMIFI
jgi:hypothetical protein